MTSPSINRRILVIDDNESVHEDFRKLLVGGMPETPTFDLLAQELFGDTLSGRAGGGFEVDSAYQGVQGLELVRRALADRRPYAMAFVDVRMPPGWDGIETVRRIWQEDPALQVVICSAYSDHSWEQTVAALGETDRLVILRKPFENIEVRQLGCALTAKWALERRARARVEDLEAAVSLRTRELELAAASLRKEIVRRERMETELRHTHKLEAMGRLAAGIAHEINSPMQFVSSSLDFIRQSLPAIVPLLEAARADNPELDYLVEEVPAALDDATTGLLRMAKIVCSMKSLSHPGQTILTPVDVNQALQSALTVCHSEIRQHADIVPDLRDIPTVLGNATDLGQTFLNLIINAADAIREVSEKTQRRGTLRVETSVVDGCVVAAIGDDGTGIPPDIRDKIFEPFFTTKEVGRGTGQGLAIARTMVVDRFGGTLDFESKVGKGTTFYVRLPIPKNDEVAA